MMVNAKEDIRTWTQHFPVIQKSYLALESKYSLGNSKKLQLLICYEDKTNFQGIREQYHLHILVKNWYVVRE